MDKKVVLEKLEDYNECQGMSYSGRGCQDALETWVATHPEDTWKAAKLTRQRMNSWNALPLFSKGIEKKQGDCKDNDLKLAVTSGLALPDGKSEIVGTAKRIGLQTCFNEMKDDLVKVAKEDANAFKNICQTLKEKNLLGSLQAKKCVGL